MMAEMVDEPIKTFSVGFNEREANEFEYARIVSKAFKTEHHEITITPEQFFAELPNLVWHEDEPLGFDRFRSALFRFKTRAKNTSKSF